MVEQIVIPFNICKPPILAPERCVLGRTCSQGAVDGQVVREVLSGLWTNGGMFLARLGTGFRPKGDGRPVVQAEGYMKNAYTSMIQYAYKWLKLLQYIYIYIRLCCKMIRLCLAQRHKTALTCSDLQNDKIIPVTTIVDLGS